ncbi:hypothetical protein ACRAKI_19265 [Saccharothrix isguenensis]
MDRRLVLPAFETGPTQLWSVPRRRRYGPLLGGMALDVVLLAAQPTGRLLIHTGVWSAADRHETVWCSIEPVTKHVAG